MTGAHYQDEVDDDGVAFLLLLIAASFSRRLFKSPSSDSQALRNAFVAFGFRTIFFPLAPLPLTVFRFCFSDSDEELSSDDAFELSSLSDRLWLLLHDEFEFRRFIGGEPLPITSLLLLSFDISDIFSRDGPGCGELHDARMTSHESFDDVTQSFIDDERSRED